MEVRLSASGDAESHGDKLYLMYAKDRESYQNAAQQQAPIGQVIVKQSWTPKEVSLDDYQARLMEDVLDQMSEMGFPKTHTIEKSIVRNLNSRSIHLRFAGKKSTCQIHSRRCSSCTKRTTKPTKTDQGWVYGVVEADGSEVIQFGKIDQCMSCHVDAGPDRLFGLPGQLGIR